MRMRLFVLLLCNLCLVLPSLLAQGNQPGHSTRDPNKVIIKRQKKPVDAQVDSFLKAQAKMTHIDGIYIPKDLFDCFKELDKAMDEDVRDKFIKFSDAEVDKRTHASLGMWIKRRWALDGGSRLAQYFNKMGVPHAEYMVGIIIQSYHRHLNKRDLQIKEQVEHFRKLWNEKQKKEAEKMLKNNKK